MSVAELSSRPAIRCRLIEAVDVPAVVRLLEAPFPDRSADYWNRGFAHLSERDLPQGVPRFGYVLERSGELIAVLLTIYSTISDGSSTSLRCNLSTWYVLPEYRALSTILDGLAMRDRSVTYINISAAPHTVAMHEARGFRCYCRGQMLVLAALSLPRWRQRVHRIEEKDDVDVPEHLRDLVRDHRRYGCTCLLCHDGSRTEVVILRRVSLKLRRRWIQLPRLPAFQVVYGPVGKDLSRWLGAIGRYLLLNGGSPFLLFGVNERLAGVVGYHLRNSGRRYVRGSAPVSVGDLSYTEVTVFGP